jgi:cyclophilin family peptidyl-prolyl cis-trans isomerase
MFKKAILVLIIILILLGGGAFYFNSKRVNQVIPKTNQLTEVATPISTSIPTPTAMPTAEKGPYPMEIDKYKSYQAVVETTAGIFKIELNAGQTPITVNNFVALARRNFYNSTIFHRVISGFMIQGGDPQGNGAGGPGYKFDDEPFTGEYNRGVVAMANSGPNTNGSQFFIMHQDNPLSKNYVIFGKVIYGMEVIDKIAESPVQPNINGGENSQPVKPTIINSIQIVES